MAQYRAGIAIHTDSAELVVFELSGCTVHGRDRDEVLELAPVVIAGHLAWLSRHALPSPGDLGAPRFRY